MLLFILLVFLRLLSRKQISIHLMLLFIDTGKNGLSSGKLISIHLMLLFIFKLSCIVLAILSFQYISCYCLSIKHQIIHLCLNYFNTSHVTVYLCSFSAYVAHSSNFNTSHVTVYHIGYNTISCSTVFQYISCYCLSNFDTSTPFGKFNFNTSHVTVYHVSLCCATTI